MSLTHPELENGVSDGNDPTGGRGLIVELDKKEVEEEMLHAAA
jgi:hypothetical protein